MRGAEALGNGRLLPGQNTILTVPSRLPGLFDQEYSYSLWSMGDHEMGVMYNLILALT